MKRHVWIALAAACALGRSIHAAGQEVGVYIPAFRSEQKSPLGLNAATVVNLAIWKTLRRAPYPNPHGLSFGDAIVHWSDAPMGSRSPLEAARSTGTQLVLDGAAFPYGDGAVVTTRLYITAPTEADLETQTWVLRLDTDKLGLARAPPSTLSLECDVIPERILQFVSIALKGTQLATFESAGLLQVHKGSPHGPVIGTVGDNFRALKQSGPVAQISTDTGLKGFLVLPEPTPELEQVASFTGGVVRVLRGDWDGAVSLLAQVAESDKTSTSIRIDAHLLSAFSLDKLGKDGASHVDRAAVLSPSAPRILKYRVMITTSSILRLLSAGDAKSARALLPSLSRAVDNVALVSAASDPWLTTARQVVGVLQP